MALALALSACGYFGGHAQAHVPPPAGAPAPTVLDPAQKALEGMIDAVGPGTGRAPVSLKFSIRSRPEVGAADDIDFALIPTKPGIRTLTILFGSRGGLDVVSGGASRQFPRPPPGAPILGSISVRAERAGIFTVTAAVGVVTADHTVVWPYSIPLIVGAGPPLSAGAAPTPDPATAGASP